jgi:hypothetical protein
MSSVKEINYDFCSERSSAMLIAPMTKYPKKKRERFSTCIITKKDGTIVQIKENDMFKNGTIKKRALK